MRPLGGEMNSRILFLDYDGVVNTPMWNERGTKVSYGFPEDGKVNNFQAVQWVSEFCRKCNFDIVVTSSWREEKNYRECLTGGGLRGEIAIAGALPVDEKKSRGELIRDYLLAHPEIKYYLIADDEEDLLPEQIGHLVKTNPCYGFLEPEFHRCIALYLKMKSGNR